VRQPHYLENSGKRNCETRTPSHGMINSVDGFQDLAHRGAAFVGMLGFGAVIPMLPVYLHEQAGASTFLTGLLVGLSSAFALLGRLLAGKTADRKGRRIALLLEWRFAPWPVCSICPCSASQPWRPAVCCMGWGRVLCNGSGGMAVDVAPDNRRAQTLGYLRPEFGAAFHRTAIGQALGTMASVALFLTASSIAVMAIVFVIDEHPRPHGHVSSRWFPPPVLLPGIVLGLGNVTYAAMADF